MDRWHGAEAIISLPRYQCQVRPSRRGVTGTAPELREYQRPGRGPTTPPNGLVCGEGYKVCDTSHPAFRLAAGPPSAGAQPADVFGGGVALWWYTVHNNNNTAPRPREAEGTPPWFRSIAASWRGPERGLPITKRVCRCPLLLVIGPCVNFLERRRVAGTRTPVGQRRKTKKITICCAQPSDGPEWVVSRWGPGLRYLESRRAPCACHVAGAVGKPTCVYDPSCTPGNEV